MHLIYKNNCRICNNPVLKPAFSLGNHYLHGNFINPAKNIYPPTRKIPVELVRCDPAYNDGCGLLQLKHTVPPSILYSDYGYRSSGNTTMQNWLKWIVGSVMELNPNVKSVMDIGANDLFTLKQFHNSVRRVGVDGCDIISKVEKENIEVFNGLYPDVLYGSEHCQFDVILSISCLYDIESINGFVKNVAFQLKNGGIWVFEVAYLPTILKNVDYSHMVHEHLETYSLGVLEKLLARHSLRIFRAKITETNGGSILCYATNGDVHKNAEDEKHLQQLRFAEFNMMLDTDEPYITFRDKIAEHGRDVNSLITKIVRQEKKTVHLYSASTKGNVLLQHAGLDNKLIQYAAERSPEKVGCRTLGTNIEIISEDESRKMKPDYYLVLIPAFKNEILEREKEIISQGTKFVFPFPYPISVY